MTAVNVGALLTLPEAAARLGVTPGTIRRWIRTGDLPAHRLPGGHFRVSSTALDDFISACAVGAES
jgi:excisionase family DNA binding protein